MPEFGKKISASKTGKPRPDMYGEHNPSKRPEVQMKISKKLRGVPKPQTSGCLNGNWRGGISPKPYCEKWTSELRNRIRTFFNFECVLCDKPQSENITETNRVFQLHCHHVYYNKNGCCDGTEVHFAALCLSCHMKTGTNRDQWKYIILRIIEEIYNDKSYYTKEEYSKITNHS